jgi:hypothetical protein
MKRRSFFSISLRSHSLFVCAAILLFAASVVLAQSNQTNEVTKNNLLRIYESSFLVVSDRDEQGIAQERLEPVPEMLPSGSIVQYSIMAINTSFGCPCIDLLKDVVLIAAIPTRTVYVQGSVTSLGLASFSKDGGQSYFLLPAPLAEGNADGLGRIGEVESEQYTNIKWVISTLGPQERLTVSYRVRVK